MKNAFIIMVLWIFNEKLVKYNRVRKNKEIHKKCAGSKFLMRYDAYIIIPSSTVFLGEKCSTKWRPTDLKGIHYRPPKLWLIRFILETGFFFFLINLCPEKNKFKLQISGEGSKYAKTLASVGENEIWKMKSWLVSFRSMHNAALHYLKQLTFVFL